MRTSLMTPDPEPSFDLMVDTNVAMVGNDPLAQIAVASRLLADAATNLYNSSGLDAAHDLADCASKALRELAR
jgi:hypothetical protein